MRRPHACRRAAITVALVASLAVGSASVAATLQQKLLAADGGSGDRLGTSLAIHGDTIVAGAPRDNSFQGAVYVFTRSGDTWTQAAKLTASDGVPNDRFGESIAIDGDTIVVGAPFEDVDAKTDQGSAYVFTRSGDTWTQAAKLTTTDGAAGDWVGHSVAIEGDTIVAGAPQDDIGTHGNRGSAYTFARSGDTWAQTARLTASDGLPGDFLGYSVAIDGDTIVAGARFDDTTSGSTFLSGVGSVYTFAATGGNRTQTAKLTATDAADSDWLGYSVAIDGDTIVAGALGDNSVQGSAYTFTRTGGNRTQTAKLTASDGVAQQSFGTSVAIDGDTIIVGEVGDVSAQGAGFAGAVFTFARTGGNRTEIGKLTDSNPGPSDQLGSSVAIAGDTIVAGAPGDTVAGRAGQGSVVAFFEPAAPVNDSPVAVDDAYSTPEDTTLDVPALGVLGNDTDTDGDALSVSVGSPTDDVDHGSLSLRADGSFNYTPNADYCGSDAFTYKATDGTADSNAVTVTITVECVNDPPVVILSGPNAADEGRTEDYSYGTTDVDSASFTHAVDCGATGTVVPGSDVFDDTTGDGSFSCSFPDDDPTATAWDPSTVTVTVEDDGGGSDTDAIVVTVSNLDPLITGVSGPVDPAATSTSVTVTASFTDEGISDTHTCAFDWADGTSHDEASVVETPGGGTCSDSHAYSATGVYTVQVTVTDDDGGSHSSLFQYVVIYDPDAGFVTGGGWIDSPSGAYTPGDSTDPDITGMASFGFVSKYVRGATTPSGNTEFQFHAANLNFESTSYEWLVIAGPKAQYKGWGTINGAGTYRFILTATDGQVAGGGGVDRFRIKIWDPTTETIIYDNQVGETDDYADATDAIERGSIVIHKK